MVEDEHRSGLIRYIAQTLDVPVSIAERVIADVLAHHAETLEEFAVRRHAQLRQTGELRNEAIFAVIADEACQRPFRVSSPSTRKVRRIIYG